jgi:hypothetical protein
MSGFDIAVVVVAGGYVLAGAFDRIKQLGNDRRAERQKLADGPEPVCGCTHHLAYHDLRDGRCYAEVKRPTADTDADAAPVDVWQQCPCRRYAGPEPLATLYAPQIARTGADPDAADQV